MTRNARKNRGASRMAILVLGMHRSGTSALSGLLTKLGGDGSANLLGASSSNPLGHFETRGLYQVLDELLASAGTSWEDYCPFPESWLTSPKAAEFLNHIITLLDVEFGSSEFYVLKDPRICRLLPFWHQVLEEMHTQPLFVHIHRNPIEVAQSLHKRNGFDLEYGYLLWLRHILDAEAGSRNQKRSFTSYDRIIESWPTEIEKIGNDLGISWPKYSGSQLSELGAMIRPDLKHNVSGGIIHSKVFSSWFRDTLDVFDRWAKHGENPVDHAKLDQIKQEFDQSAIAFAGTVRSKSQTQTEQMLVETESITTERDETQAQLDKTLVEIETITTERDETQAQLDKTLVEIETITTERDETHAQLDKTLVEIEALTSERNALNEQKSIDFSILRQREAELDDTLRELEAVNESLANEQKTNAEISDELTLGQGRTKALETVIIRQDSEMARAQETLSKYQNDLNALRIQRQSEIKKNILERDKTIAQVIDAFKSSSSWRITAPLRWFVAHFKK